MLLGHHEVYQWIRYSHDRFIDTTYLREGAPSEEEQACYWYQVWGKYSEWYKARMLEASAGILSKDTIKKIDDAFKGGKR